MSYACWKDGAGESSAVRIDAKTASLAAEIFVEDYLAEEEIEGLEWADDEILFKIVARTPEGDLLDIDVTAKFEPTFSAGIPRPRKES